MRDEIVQNEYVFLALRLIVKKEFALDIDDILSE